MPKCQDSSQLILCGMPRRQGVWILLKFSSTGEYQEFIVIELTKIKDYKFVFIVEVKKLYIRLAKKQYLLTLKNIENITYWCVIYDF